MFTANVSIFYKEKYDRKTGHASEVLRDQVHLIRMGHAICLGLIL